MFKNAMLLFVIQLCLMADPLPHISPIDTGYMWEYEYSLMWGGCFHEGGHQYHILDTRRIITVDSMEIVPGIESSDSTIYYLTVNDSGIAAIATDSFGTKIFDTVYIDTTLIALDTVIYTEDTVITKCEIFLQNYKIDAESLSVYDKDAMDTMKATISFEQDSLACYIEQFEYLIGLQYDKREFYYVENAGALYLYDISSFACAVQEYYYNLVSFNGEPVIDTADLFDQIGKNDGLNIKSGSIKKGFSPTLNSNQIHIYDLQGKLVDKTTLQDRPAILKELSPGIYFSVYKNHSNNLISEKMLVR